MHDDVRDAIKEFDRLFDGSPPNSIRLQLAKWASWLVHLVDEKSSLAAVLVRNWYPDAIDQSDDSVFRNGLEVEEARLVVAREHGFSSWDAVEAIGDSSLDPVFEQAVDLIVAGNIDQLKQMLEKHPTLVNQSSRYGHQATLLHYLSANGLELRRQIAPSNGPAIASLLMQSGAAPDAITASVDEFEGRTPLELIVTSERAVEAGTCRELVDVLVSAGASVDGVKGDGTPLSLAISAASISGIEALSESGANKDDLVFAACCDDRALVASILMDDQKLNQASVSQLVSPAIQPNTDLLSAIQSAASHAKRVGRTEIVETLQSLSDEIGDCLDHFDMDWHNRESKDLLNAVPNSLTGKVRQFLLQQMVAIDMEYRWASQLTAEDSSENLEDEDEKVPHDCPLLDDYLREYPQLGLASEIPLELVVEEFRIRLENGRFPSTDEYLERFPTHADELPVALDDVLDDQKSESANVCISVYHRHSREFFEPLNRKIEIGRQRPEEPAPYQKIEGDHSDRLIIASKKERFLSRTHIELEPLPGGKIRAKNCSGKNSISLPIQGDALAPGESREFPIPVSLVIESKTIRIGYGI